MPETSSYGTRGKNQAPDLRISDRFKKGFQMKKLSLDTRYSDMRSNVASSQASSAVARAKP
mgnify:CR=1 FL=1